MLELSIPKGSFFDEKIEEFFHTKEMTVQMEHSLVSLSRWESRWHKPFLSRIDKTPEEVIDYIKCMTLTKNVDEDTYKYISRFCAKQINEYIENPMTATVFGKEQGRANNEQITSELVYYWMIALNIPFECQKWHLNRLLTLIRVCNIKNQPPKKMSKNEIMSRNAALNAARRKRLGTKG